MIDTSYAPFAIAFLVIAAVALVAAVVGIVVAVRTPQRESSLAGPTGREFARAA